MRLGTRTGHMPEFAHALKPSHIGIILGTTRALLGDGARVTLFGSRVDDRLKGGDVDLMVEVSQPIDEPALLSARLASRVSRAMDGRRVDVVLKAPNLQRQAIHDVAQQTWVVLWSWTPLCMPD